MISKIAKYLTIFMIFLYAVPAYGESVHYLAVHVNENDKATMNIALNNISNVNKYYESKGEKVVFELVAYGPGLHMLREDTSPYKERIAAMSLEIDDIQFTACGNTHNAMIKKSGKDVKLISEAVIETSGVVRLMELQEKGYSYVKP